MICVSDIISCVSDIISVLAPFLKPVLRLFDANSFIAKDVREFFTGVVKQAVAARKEDNDKVRDPCFTERYHNR